MLKRSPFRDLDEITEHDDASLDLFKKRIIPAALFIVFFAVIIASRLWFLQISHGEEYKQRAYNNRVRIRDVAAPRGHILDRNGLELVTNRPSFNVVLVREDSHDIDDVLKKLAVILDEDVSEFWKKIRESANSPLHEPIRIKEDIDWESLAYLENHKHKLSGIRIEVQPRRVYHFGDMAAHIIGYLGAISKQELANAKEGVYEGGDLIGKSGLEKLREADLRGEKGSSSSEVNARGFVQQVLKREEPLSGKEIHLTLDAHLQKAAEEFMINEDKAGAVVAMEVKTGRLLTLVSTPPINLEAFIGGISHKNWNALLKNPQHPLRNKTGQGTYPPGSTYKMISALAGLSKGVIDENTVFYCPGYYRFGNRTYRCWKHSGHGAVNLKRAISESCDVYFYHVGQRVGVDGLAEFARKLGLGAKTGVAVEHEKSGLVPTKAWKKSRYNRKWQEGETLSIAIGQGFNLVTPLQICLMTSMIANGGIHYLPQLIEEILDADGNVVEQFKPKIVKSLNVPERYIQLIRQGMQEVVHGKRGTARNARIKGLTIAGKTGTAQVVKVAQYRHLKEKDIPYKYRDHAWFTAYAPAEDPEIAVTVLVEHGLHGGSGAAPIAKKVLETYFADRLAAEEESETSEKKARR
jgi:penicillin-binding protein 2